MPKTTFHITARPDLEALTLTAGSIIISEIKVFIYLTLLPEIVSLSCKPLDFVRQILTFFQNSESKKVKRRIIFIS